MKYKIRNCSDQYMSQLASSVCSLFVWTSADSFHAVAVSLRSITVVSQALRTNTAICCRWLWTWHEWTLWRSGCVHTTCETTNDQWMHYAEELLCQ